VLLPSATVFLLLLCNDRAVLGPWVNGPKTNLFTSAVVAVLVTLSVVLTASVLFPAITAGQIEVILTSCVGASLLTGGFALARRLRTGSAASLPIDRSGRASWRMPPLTLLDRPVMSTGRKIGMSALRVYLAIAMVLVIVRIAELALTHHP
jgi:hypothetical protein